MKLHRREVHEEGPFACFVCNDNFKTHKQLKTHIQKSVSLRCLNPQIELFTSIMRTYFLKMNISAPIVQKLPITKCH